MNLLKPNYEKSFNAVCGKILRNQSSVTNSLVDGQEQDSHLLSYNNFVMLSIISSLNSDDTDTRNMNLNLDYLQRI